MKIDPHVHLRDGESQSHKETLLHGFSIAWKSGLSAVFEMPNTVPPLTSELAIMERIRSGEKALEKLEIPLFHGIIPGLTGSEKQIKEVVGLWKKLFPKTPGLKMFAGHSTGNMGITEYENQKTVYRILVKEGFTGVLMVHCEKESFINPELFDPRKPETHLAARPPEAEVESVRDQIKLAEESGFAGTLHICHISVPESLGIIEAVRGGVPFKISCGITPHHALLSVENMKTKDGLLLKMNPPLRAKEMQKEMFEALLEGRIDWIETDHAPHTLTEKRKEYLSGIPVLQFYNRFIDILHECGAARGRVDDLCFGNIVSTFNLSPELFKINQEKHLTASDEYEFNPFDTASIHTGKIR